MIHNIIVKIIFITEKLFKSIYLKIIINITNEIY